MAFENEEVGRPVSIRERMRSFEAREPQDDVGIPRRPATVTRSYTTPAIITASEVVDERPPMPPRPQVSASEEIIQRARTGLLELGEKGKATFQEVGNSIGTVRERFLGERRTRSDFGNATEELLRPSASRSVAFTSAPGRRRLSRAASEEIPLIDFESEEEEGVLRPGSVRSTSGTGTKMDLERKEVRLISIFHREIIQ